MFKKLEATAWHEVLNPDGTETGLMIQTEGRHCKASEKIEDDFMNARRRKRKQASMGEVKEVEKKKCFARCHGWSWADSVPDESRIEFGEHNFRKLADEYPYIIDDLIDFQLTDENFIKAPVKPGSQALTTGEAG